MASVEFGQRQVANEIRGRLEPFLGDDDSRRSKTIELQDRVPDDVVQRVREEAADSRGAEADKAGQASLTDRERKEIDFSKDGVNVPYARSVKGVAKAEGVEDWLQYSDFDVTVDENRNVLQRAGREERGQSGQGRSREKTELQRGRRAKRQRRQQAEEAKAPAFGGNVEAAEFLREEQRFEDDLFDISLRGGGPSGSDFEGLEAAHEERSERAQRVDERRSAKVTRDPLKWSQNKAQYDFPGIDTVQPGELHAERSKPAQKVDEREQAPIADSREQWAQNSDEYDWPGVDTKRRPTEQEIVNRAKEMKSARMDATMRYEPMSAEDEVASQALAADISLSPEEATRGVGAVGENALGGFNVTRQGETAPSAPIDERPPDLARGEDPFDMSDDGGVLADTRDQQASLDVGRSAGVTEDRSGQIAGSADFADRRDDLRPDSDAGEQSGLVEMEDDVGGDGQADLFGGNATTTSGGEYR